MYIWEFNTKAHEKIFDQSIAELGKDPKTALQVQFGMNLGHTNIHYLNEKHPLNVDRMIAGTVKGDGGFSSEEQMYQYVAEAIIKVSAQIKDWVKNRGNADVNIKTDNLQIEADGNRFVACVNLNTSVGESYEVQTDGTIQRKMARVVKFVLDAACNRNNPIYSLQGFYLKTAYPDVHEKHAELEYTYSKEEFVEEFESLMKASSNLDKLLFMMRNSEPNLKAYATENPIDRQKELKLIRTLDNGKPWFTAYISKDHIKIREHDQQNRAHNVDINRVQERCPEFAGKIQECAKYIILMEQHKLSDLAKSVGLENISLKTVQRQNNFISRLPQNLVAQQSKKDSNRIIIRLQKQFNDHTCSFSVNFEADVPKITCFVDGQHIMLKDLKASSMDKIAQYAEDIIDTIKGHDMSYKQEQDRNTIIK